MTETEIGSRLGGRDAPAIAATERQIEEDMEQLLTVEEAAQIANCHTETIRRGYSSGQLKRLRFGVRQVRIRLSDLWDWLERGAKTKR